MRPKRATKRAHLTRLLNNFLESSWIIVFKPLTYRIEITYFYFLLWTCLSWPLCCILSDQFVWSRFAPFLAPNWGTQLWNQWKSLVSLSQMLKQAMGAFGLHSPSFRSCFCYLMMSSIEHESVGQLLNKLDL